MQLKNKQRKVKNFCFFLLLLERLRYDGFYLT